LNVFALVRTINSPSDRWRNTHQGTPRFLPADGELQLLRPYNPTGSRLFAKLGFTNQKCHGNSSPFIGYSTNVCLGQDADLGTYNKDQAQLHHCMRLNQTTDLSCPPNPPRLISHAIARGAERSYGDQSSPPADDIHTASEALEGDMLTVDW